MTLKWVYFLHAALVIQRPVSVYLRVQSGDESGHNALCSREYITHAALMGKLTFTEQLW